MKITNEQNLPDAIVNAVMAHEHKGADYSASMLEKSPRMVELQRVHWDEITEDAADRIYSLMGTATHYIVERAGGSAIQEGYIEADVLGKKLSGTFDMFDGEIVSDIKTVSVWQIIFGGAEKWEAQLNTYAYLLRSIGFEPKRLRVIAIMRDWKKSDAKFKDGYPKHQVMVIDIPMWDAKVTEDFIKGRVTAFEAVRGMKDLPECTKEEMWEKKSTFAVMKEGRKSAVRVLETQAEADTMASGLGKGHSVQHRPGERTRCESYCNVAQFCSQYQDYVKTKGDDNG